MEAESTQSSQAQSPSPASGTAATARNPNSEKGPGVKVSEGAVRYAKERLLQRGTPDAAIRLGVRGGGCSGFSYVVEFSDDPPRDRDTVASYDGVTFYIDKKSLVFLNGSTLDYTKSVMFRGFQFLNPQEATKCGCGHSFTVK